MNAPFRIASPEGDQELEKKFIEEAAAKDMIQLKGHRSVHLLLVCVFVVYECHIASCKF